MEKKILILGGGFAGVEAAIKMQKYGYTITLVSDRDYLFIYPISIWVPVQLKKFEDVIIPLSELKKKHKFNLIVDEVVRINSGENKVELKTQMLDYDYLIIAMGMSKIMIPGIENTLSICGKPKDSIRIKDKLEELIKQGSGKIAIGFGGNPIDKSAVRGGPAFELLFNISHFLKKRKIRNKFEITFFAPMEEPGKKMGSKAYSSLAMFFKRYGIHTKTGIKITSFDKSFVNFQDGSKLESDLIVYIPGGSGHQVIVSSGLPVNKAGFITIDNNCKVDNTENIYAVGDVSALEGPAWAAKQGHIAEVMADAAAFNIHNQISGISDRNGYQKHLNIICLMDTGDGAAFVYRDSKSERMIPLPIIGHWLKKGWGFYFRNSKLKKIPRIPGM